MVAKADLESRDGHESHDEFHTILHYLLYVLTPVFIILHVTVVANMTKNFLKFTWGEK